MRTGLINCLPPLPPFFKIFGSATGPNHDRILITGILVTAVAVLAVSLHFCCSKAVCQKAVCSPYSWVVRDLPHLSESLAKCLLVDHACVSLQHPLSVSLTLKGKSAPQTNSQSIRPFQMKRLFTVKAIIQRHGSAGHSLSSCIWLAVDNKSAWSRCTGIWPLPT